MAIPLLCLALAYCARQGSPSGGPKDNEPPVVLEEVPENHSVFFSGDKAEISFNEFIQLKDASKEIFISPPMRTRPDFKVKGKKLVIEFKEPLKPRSTYTINFGNAIADFTEGNPLVNYEYVFSTGDHIDSLSVPGRILNAFDLKPVKGIIAMVYQDDNDTIPLDSLPLKVPPKSASKSTSDGNFSINNLAEGKYLLFALEDLNNNYYFDLPDERIAFLDSLIELKPSLKEPPATDTADTVRIANAALQDYYTLYLFKTIYPVQRLLSKKLIGRHLLQYIYQLPVDTAWINGYGFQPEKDSWHIAEFGILKDTINFWLLPGMPDTFRIIANAPGIASDTSRFSLPPDLPERQGRRRGSVGEGLKINTNTPTGFLELNKSLELRFNLPLLDYFPEKMVLMTPLDTLIPDLQFPDSVKRKAVVFHTFKPGDICRMSIYDSAFIDLSGAYNDSLTFDFKIREKEDYGILLVDITVPESSGQYIFQLMTEKETIINEKYLSANSRLRFDYLRAGNYLLKAILDSNRNGKWDSGNYREGRLPERVLYYPVTLNIRANWELQEEWAPGD